MKQFDHEPVCREIIEVLKTKTTDPADGLEVLLTCLSMTMAICIHVGHLDAEKVISEASTLLKDDVLVKLDAIKDIK